MRYFYHDQGSFEWRQSRCGFITGSNFAKLVTTQGAKSQSASTYINEVIAEREVRIPIETYQSKEMKEGSEREDEARSKFELLHNIDIKQVGMIALDDHDVGCSPDGLWADTGIEIKCPKRGTHTGYRRSGKLPSRYFQQVQGTMWILGLDHYWFYSYNPVHPDFKIKVERDDEWIDKASKIIIEAAQLVDEETRRLIDG
jgi:hypothetical protein